MARRWTGLAVVVLCASACDNNFEAQSELRRTRVLAVKAEPPELALPSAGGLPPPVSLTPLAYSPAGPVTVTFALCRFADPYAQGFECPGRDGLPLPEAVLDFSQPEVQKFLLQEAGNPDGSGEPLDLGDPSLEAKLSSGIPLFVGYLAQGLDEGDRGVERGVRRLLLRRTDSPNQNPDLVELRLEDGSVLGERALRPDEEVRIFPVLRDGAREPFEAQDGPTQEDVFFSWHATGEGEVKGFRSQEGGEGEPSSTYLAPAAPEPVQFFVVARDGRGGVGWLTRQVDVAAP